MGLFTKKKTAKMSVQPQKPLIQAFGYSVSPITVISKADCMILRCKVQFPFANSTNIQLSVKNGNGELVSTKCVFMGKGAPQARVGNDLVFQELVYSVFVPYPEQDLIFQVTDLGSKQVIHEQLIQGSQIANLRAGQDGVFYKFASNDPYYQEWFNNTQRLSDYELYMQSQKRLYYMPKFSIVVPLFQSNLSYLTQLLDSIMKQTYANWELIFVNASPEIEQLTAGLDRLQAEDGRIRVVELEQNEGITLNTAHGIDAATGDYVCFVDHDDLIEPNTLFEYAQRINEKPNAALLYCDEDKLFADGHYGEVFFKPDFSPFLLRSTNYISHMLMIERDLLLTLDYKNAKYDGSQDHNLCLQVAEKTKNIEHIAKPLYHWRVHQNSTAEADSAKPYAISARLDAVRDHLSRMGISATVEQNPTVEYATKITYSIPDCRPKVSIIVPTKDGVNLLSKCLDSIFQKTTYENYEIIVVENNSEKQETFEYYKTLEGRQNVQICKFEGEFNFSKIMNFGRTFANGEYLLLLNNDTEVITPSWIEGMLGICSQPEVGIVGTKLLFPDETIQHAGIVIANKPRRLFYGLPKEAINYGNFLNIEREWSAVTAACLMIEAKVYDSIGGFDETIKVAFNDIDFCLKALEQEKLVVYTPFVELYHYESISRGYDAKKEGNSEFVSEQGRLLLDWRERMSNPDPYHTPNVRQNWEGAYYKF